MALQDILAAITGNADKRIADARSEHQRTLTQLREESERALAKKKQELAVTKQERMKQLEAKAHTHALAQKRNMVLGKKKELLDRVYEEAVSKLSKLDEKEIEELLRACIKSIKGKGEIRPSAAHEKLLKKICPSEQFKMGSTTNAKGGFLFVSDTEEQDFTFENIVGNVLRPQSELTISSMIF